MLPVRSLTKHALLAGSTGSGKTTTAMEILRQLWLDHRIPFLVIEPVNSDADDYRRLAAEPGFADLEVCTVGDEGGRPLRFNPFEVPPGRPGRRAHGQPAACFKAAFGLWEPLPSIYQDALSLTYLRSGFLASERPSGPAGLADRGGVHAGDARGHRRPRLRGRGPGQHRGGLDPPRAAAGPGRHRVGVPDRPAQRHRRAARPPGDPGAQVARIRRRAGADDGAAAQRRHRALPGGARSVRRPGARHAGGGGAPAAGPVRRAPRRPRTPRPRRRPPRPSPTRSPRTASTARA